MRGLTGMRLLSALPVLAALVAPAAADSLQVQVAADVGVPAEQIKAAIAAELGAEIVDATGDLGAIEMRLDAQQRLAIAHTRSDGTQLVRVVSLPALPSDRLALIAFVTGNLVRDQLADLAAATTPAQTAPAALPIDSSPGSMPVTSPGPSMPVVAPPSTALAPAMPVTARAEAEVTVPLSIGIVPPLSTDRLFTSRARVRGALNVIVGASSSIDGVSLSGAVDLSANVRGLQIGGAATLAGNTRGMQLAGALTVARDLHGGQLAGAAAVARDVEGLQVAGAGSLARDMHGIQLAGAAVVARDARGLQVAGATSVARKMRGVQIAGGATIAERFDGLQLAPINIAGRARGLQLGVINISDEGEGAQIGVLNFVRRGRTDIDAWAESNGLAAVALRHGGRHTHNIYAVGTTPDAGDTPLVGLGFGFHTTLGTTLGTPRLDLDAMAWQTHMFQDGVGLLSQARATLAIPLGPVDGFVAAAYNVSVEDDGETAPVKMAFARTIDPMSTSVDVKLWPSLAIGVRGHLGAMR